MNTASVASLATAMRNVSGVTWDYRITGAIGRSSYKEHYAVLFRTDRVAHISNYVWNDTGDKFEREPHIVRLRCLSTSADFTFINWHTIWGNTTQREAEIREIRNVFNSVQNSISTDKDVILLGDHNRDATSPWWSNLTSLSPTVSYRVNEATTLNSSCAFANPYDHFWFQAAYVKEFSNAGRDYIANMCNFYKLSDHAPIWMRLYNTGDDD
jgi:endonuclease/exonuclease/phosphatase family metal-dependent hydrolase